MKEITIQELAKRVHQKKIELGYTYPGFIQKNNGKRRTQSKRNLLRNIEENAREKNQKPPFKANY